VVFGGKSSYYIDVICLDNRRAGKTVWKFWVCGGSVPGAKVEGLSRSLECWDLKFACMGLPWLK
jgi:hypothetical protein